MEAAKLSCIWFETTMQPNKRQVLCLPLQKSNYMRFLMALLLMVALALGIWFMFFKDSSPDSGPKQQPLKVGDHSSAFNQSVSVIVAAYLSLKEAFVNADTAAIKKRGKETGSCAG